MQIIEYRGVKVRRSVADLREAKYRSQGKDCYVSSDFLLACIHHYPLLLIVDLLFENTAVQDKRRDSD